MSKYRNVKTVVDGIRFDSKREANHWLKLRLLQKDGRIYGLDRQTPFALVVNGVKIATYRADFVYNDSEGNFVVEDAKGVRTRDFIIKKKLVKALYGIDIREV